MQPIKRRSLLQLLLGALLAPLGLGASKMTQKSWPWSGTTVGDATLAPYTNKFFADMFQLLNVYDRTTMGVVDTGHASYPGGLFVTAGAGFVSVDTGVGVSDGMWLTNDASVNLIPDDTPTFRTDLVVIQKDVTAQTARLALVKGTDGSAVPPALTQTALIWEIPLAEVPLTPGPTIGTIVNVAVAVRTALGPGYQFNRLTADDSAHTAAAWNSLGAGLKVSLGPGTWLIWGALTFEVQSVSPALRYARIQNNTLGQTESVGITGVVDNGDTFSITLAPKVITAGVVTELELQFYAGATDDKVIGSPITAVTSFVAIRVV